MRRLLTSGLAHLSLSTARRLYSGARYTALLITFVHVLCLPLVASYDGMEYVYLSNLVGTPSFASLWNYLRTPLFPASLHLAFLLGGQQPYAAMLVTTLFGLGGVLLMGSVVHRVAGEVAGALTLIILSLYPVLITYEHMLLTESGIFFFLALIVFLLVEARITARPVLVAIGLAFTTALGYYWRPTIIYISPVITTAFVLARYLPSESPQPYKSLLRTISEEPGACVQDVAIVLIGPWLLAYPWIHLSSQHPSTDMLETITSGMYKQVLVPPDDPLFGDLGPRYKAIIRDEVGNKRLPLDGLSIVGEGRNEYLKKLSKAYIRAGLIRLIWKHPVRYALAVSRSFVYFLGVPHYRVDDENWSFSGWVFGTWSPDTDFEHLNGWIAAYNDRFRPQKYAGGAALGRMFRSLEAAYTPLILLASAVSVWWLIVSATQGDPVPFAITAVPIALISLHALTMMSAARYAFPIYPIVMSDLIALCALSYRARAKKRMLDSTRN